MVFFFICGENKKSFFPLFSKIDLLVYMKGQLCSFIVATLSKLGGGGGFFFNSLLPARHFIIDEVWLRLLK